jgi:benzodiazapine receptor
VAGSLVWLRRDLRRRGSRLILRRGPAGQEIARLVSRTGVDAVFWNRCYEPASRERDSRLKAELKRKDIDAESFNGSLQFEPREIRTGSGHPFQVFTPFWKACRSCPAPAAPAAPAARLDSPGSWPRSDPLASWSLEPPDQTGHPVCAPQAVAMSSPERTKRFSAPTRALLALGPVAAASILGRMATAPNLDWYATLAKPDFNPPNWVFAPVWATLYAMMAFATWRLLGKVPTPQRRAALALFFAQLALNAAWPWTFFWLQSPLTGLLCIVPQAIAIVATIAAAHRIDRISAWLLIPLAAWVGFATALNLEIGRLND